MSTRKETIAYSKIGNLAEPPIIAELMAKELTSPDLLSLAAGFTDNIVLPLELIEDCIGILKEKSGNLEHLQYGTNQGRPLLRQQALDVLNSHPGEKVNLKPENAIISNGSQQSLYLCMQVLCDPGDIVLVQSPSYFVFLELLKGLGIEAISIPADDDGNILFDELCKLIGSMQSDGRINRLKAVYLVNYFANPSSRCMKLEEKKELGNFIQKEIGTIPVLEDAAYREIYFDHPWPAQSILSMDEYDSLPCLYFGTFTKPFATGLKVGFAVSNIQDILNKMLCCKGHQDFGTAHFNQAIIETMISEGHYQKHLESIRGHYKRKAEIMDRTLRSTELSANGWKWDRPEGGLLLWLRGPDDVDTSMDSELCKKCLDAGVIYVPGDLCFAERKPLNCIRLSFGAIAEDKLVEAVERFASAACSK